MPKVNGKPRKKGRCREKKKNGRAEPSQDIGARVDPHTHILNRMGHRKGNIPCQVIAPNSSLSELLKFTWNQVLGYKIDEHISDSEQTPLLYLEHLRAILDENIVRHLAFKYGGGDDSEKG
jgi:hypothetical protein